MTATTIRRPDLPPLKILVDTNVLWSADKSVVVSPALEAFIQCHKATIRIKAIIPEVVRGELLFQQVTSACKQLEKAQDALESLSNITLKQVNIRITADEIATLVASRFDAWAKANRISVLPTPIDHIDWQAVIEDSIWRNPPFTLGASRDDDTEKGFRDSMIVETVSSFSETVADEAIIAVVSSDALVIDAVESRVGDDARVVCFSDLSELDSHVRLTIHQHSSGFAEQLQTKAAKKFFNFGYYDDSLLFTANIRDRITREFEEYLGSPLSAPGAQRNLKLGMNDKLTHTADGTWTVHRPRFVKVDAPNTYFWKSLIKTSALFYLNPGMFSMSEASYYIIETDIDVVWSANISANGRFSKLSVDSLEFVKNHVTQANEQDLRSRSLPIPDDLHSPQRRRATTESLE